MNEMDPTHTLPLPDLVEVRLAEDTKLTDPVKALIHEALGGSQSGEGAATTAGPVYLGKVKVAGFRGVGSEARLNLHPRPGVTLVVGPSGSGKSSIAEGIETLFTGTDARWATQSADRVANWRNLHNGERTSIEANLSVEGDTSRSTLTRTWAGADFTDSEAMLKRPGHSPAPFEETGWQQATRTYRPFLSYVDLGKMINSRPSQLYDNIASVLGLEYLNAAARRLAEKKREYEAVEKAEKELKPQLHEALEAVGHDDRAVKAVDAMDQKGGADYATLDALIAGVATADSGRLKEARLEAEVDGPDIDRVLTAVDTLQKAVADADDLKGTAAADAHSRAELLQAALNHNDRHTDETTCPVCGTEDVLDRDWAGRAETQITALLREAEAVREADDARRTAIRELHNLVEVSREIPAVLAEPWRAWADCRAIADPALLAERALVAAGTLADACEVVARKAREELAGMDERWRQVVDLLTEWTKLSREVQAAKPRKKEVNAALTWVKSLTTEIRDSRLDDFASHTQQIWEKLRQQSSVGLKKVSLQGSEKAPVRKLLMDVTVDDTDASALSVMSQGELHSLALSLFLPQASTADSPFGFVVIDDPVQSMDVAKVDGLAQVLDELGRDRQVVVFTHDTRLPKAFRSQGLPVTVLQVERGEKSKVKVKDGTNPVADAISDAMALAKTDNCPPGVRSNVLPSLCRDVLETAVVEAAWIRRPRTGLSAEQLQAAIDATDRLIPLAAFALFDDPTDRTEDEIKDRIRHLYGIAGTTLILQCQRGAHPGGFCPPDPIAFVRDVEGLANKIRKPEVSA